MLDPWKSNIIEMSGSLSYVGSLSVLLDRTFFFLLKGKLGISPRNIYVLKVFIKRRDLKEVQGCIYKLSEKER